jgi:hypothetical protein
MVTIPKIRTLSGLHPDSYRGKEEYPVRQPGDQGEVVKASVISSEAQNLLTFTEQQ